MRRTLAFHRDFRRYSGGHGKVWDYCNHTDAHPGWQSSAYLTPRSARDENPWLSNPRRIASEWRPEAADALFLGGNDWSAYPRDDPAKPVINLIQGVRHADPSHPLHAFLSRRAIRICVGAPVAKAILGTGQVNGPVHVIDNGLHLPDAPPASDGERDGIVVAAYKQPDLGRALAMRLQAAGRKVRLFDGWVPRPAFLAHLRGAATAVMLPLAREGFFLPGLEAMALGCATVVPDCIGNRAYLEPGINALVPPMHIDALFEAVLELDDPALHANVAAAGVRTAARFNLERERAAFHALLDDLDRAWAA